MKHNSHKAHEAHTHNTTHIHVLCPCLPVVLVCIVLGTMPALMGQAQAAYILSDLGKKLFQPEVQMQAAPEPRVCVCAMSV